MTLSRETFNVFATAFFKPLQKETGSKKFGWFVKSLLGFSAIRESLTK